MAMTKSSYLGLIIAGAIMLCSTIVFRGYLPYVGERLAPREPPAIPVALEDAHLVGVAHRTKLWSLDARLVEVLRDRDVTRLTDVTHGKVFDRGKVVFVVSAGRAIYDKKLEDLRLSRGIQVAASDGQHVSARSAHWNSRTAILTGSGSVAFRGRWGEASGEDLIADLRNKKLVMRNVSARININQLGRQPQAKEGS